MKDNETTKGKHYSPVVFNLNRNDLVRDKQDLPINEITSHDFKSSSMTLDEINGADYIVFYDRLYMKILKNRKILWDANNIKEIRVPDTSEFSSEKDVFVIEDLYFSDRNVLDKGDIICDIGNENIIFDVECIANGKITYHVKEGDTVKTGDLIATINTN